jgi:hypothetical protein
MPENELSLTSYLKGYLHSFVCLNLLQGKINGEKGLGERLMDNVTMPLSTSGPVKNSYYFAAGIFTELATELAVPIYVASTTNLKWYVVLGIDLGIKIAIRGLERLLTNKNIID